MQVPTFQNLQFHFVGLVMAENVPPLISLHSVGGSVNAYLTYPSYLPYLYYIPDYSLVIHRRHVLRLVVLLFVWQFRVWGGLRGIFMA